MTLDTGHGDDSSCILQAQEEAVAHTLLLLEAVVFDNLGLQQPAVGLVLGLDDHAGLFRLALFHQDVAGIAEAGAAVEPVVVAELVDLDAPLVRRLMRHRLCHHQRLGRRLGDDAVVGDQMVRRCSVELMGGERRVGLGRAEDEGRQSLGRLARSRVGAVGVEPRSGAEAGACRLSFCKQVAGGNGCDAMRCDAEWGRGVVAR